MTNANTNIWTQLCTPAQPYTLEGMQTMLADVAICGIFAPVHPDLHLATMRDLSVRAGSTKAARLGMTSSARTAAIRRLLERDALRIYHPQLIEIWSAWLRSDDYLKNYSAVGRAVDPIAPIAAADTVAIIRLGSDLDLEVSARTTELPLVRHEAQSDLGRRLRTAGMADALSLIAYATAATA